MRDIKEKIIDTSHELFSQFGIKSITMDDIAREMGISKKTIYQYFQDKNDLVMNVSRMHLEMEKEEIYNIKKQTSNAVETLIEESLCMRQKMSDMNPSLIYDLRKYHPQAWNLYLESKEEVYIRSLEDTLRSGISEGYFRNDIDPGILAVLRVEQIEMVLQNRAYPRHKYDFNDVLAQLFDHFLNGLVSEKGQKLLNKYKSTHDKLNA